MRRARNVFAATAARLARAIVSLALLAAAPVHAAEWSVGVNGRGQAGYPPTQKVEISYTAEGNLLIVHSASYTWDSRFQRVSIVASGGVSCNSSGANGVAVSAGIGVTSGSCLVDLRPTATMPYNNFALNGTTTLCAPVFVGFCDTLDGIYDVIGPRVTGVPSLGSQLTLTSSVGLPLPASVATLTNTGDSGSQLVLTSSATAPAIVTPFGPAPALVRNASRQYTLACDTASAGTFDRTVTFAHNGTPVQASPVSYQLQCRVLEPPELVYSPAADSPVSIPGTSASAFTRQIGVATTGGQLQGQRGLACTVPPGYVREVTSSLVATGGTAAIRLGCSSVQLPAPGVLTCTETGNPAPPPRTWPISCDANPVFTATPSFATPLVLSGIVGGADATATFTVTNTGTEGTPMAVSAPAGLGAALSIAPLVPQVITPGAAGTTYTVTCSALASTFPGSMQTLSFVHNAPGSPAELAVTCNMRTPPALEYAPSFGTGVQVAASVGAATRATPIGVTTTGGDPTGERSLACTVPPNYGVQVAASPFATGGTGAILLGCDSLATAPGQLTCTESPGGAVRVWNLTCVNRAVYSSVPRPTSAVGVYSRIGETGFVSADVAIANLGTSPLNVGPCVQLPPGTFGVSFTPGNPINSTATMRVECIAPPIGTAVVSTLSCATDDPSRANVIYKLVCVAPPMTDPGEGASPTQRLTGPSPDGGALLGSSTTVAEGPNGEEIVVVGAPNGGDDGDGRVYVYVRARGAAALLRGADKRGLGAPVAVLRAPANRGKVHAKGIGNKFGAAVAISPSGTTIAVGASTGGNANTGQVLVFAMPPGGWGDLDALVPIAVDPPAVPGVVASGFGEEVDFAPDGMLVVGAPGAIVSSIDDAGAAFVFDTGLATVGGPITATSPETGAAFGTALDVGTGMLAIGAPGENGSTGAAYFYEIDAGIVGPANQQTAPGGSIGDKWGATVAIGGTAVIVGAPNDDTAAGADSGSATVFLAGEGNDVVFASTLVPTGAGTQGAGSALGTNGDVVVLGAPFSDVAGAQQRGRAIVFDLESAVFGSGAPAGLYENTIGEAGDEFGSAIGIGRQRLLLGAPLSDEGPDVDEGRVDPFDLDRIHRGNFEF